MKIDMHVHTKERSGCGRSGEEEMVRSAVSLGLDGLFFTDHNKNAPAGRLRELNLKYAPFRVFGGIEVSVDDEHLVVLGCRSPELEKENFWSYPSLRSFLSKKGGFMFLAHPYRYNPVGPGIFSDPPDAVELHSSNTDPGNEKLILQAAGRMQTGLVCTSDAHAAENVGMYFVEINGDPRTEKGVISCLKKGDYSCAADRARAQKHFREKVAAQAAVPGG